MTFTEKYHKYVFDIQKREFIGDFEKMYQDEPKEGFDSWHQDDNRNLARRIILSILQDYNFDFIIDIGCGKGACTHLLKKKNNKVLGIDISQTALDIAKKRYSDIEFICLDIRKVDEFNEFLAKIGRKKIGLILLNEILSYIDNWKKALELISDYAAYILVSLYIPENPIGFVKSEGELVAEIGKYFEIIELVSNKKANSTIVLGRNKNAGF